MSTHYNFSSFTEIKLCELDNPQTFEVNTAANRAARSYLTKRLDHFNRILRMVSRSVPGSILSEVGGAECRREISSIQHWLNKYPAI